MSVEPIGFAMLALGLLCLWRGHLATAFAFVLTGLLGAAAAMFVGANNIQPAHLFLGFLALAIVARPREVQAAVAAVAPFKPGFWLACLVAFGALSAIFFPRLLEGATQIIPLGVSQHANTGSTVPLGPVSSNMTQTIYMAGNLICFALVVAVGSHMQGFKALAVALIAFAAANVAFALLDLVTYATGTAGVLDFIRNARYTLHDEEQVTGLKRIVGSFTETSSFARFTLGAFAFTGTLWLCGRRTALTGALALASLVLVTISTSSSGLTGVPVVLALLYVSALRLGIFQARRNSAVTALAAPLLGACIAIVILVNEEASAAIGRYMDVVVLNKLDTSSGIERSSWNAFAWRNFIDTWGLGVGLGTARTSSLLLALLSNVGAIGTVLYLLFMGTVLWRPLVADPASSFTADIRIAAANACLALTAADMLVGSNVDQGLFFFVLAGLAASFPADEARTYSSAIGSSP